MKTLEQLHAQAARYGRTIASAAADRFMPVPVVSVADAHKVVELARLLELAFKAGVNAARDGVQ